ncbi:hypothetical protein TNCV_4675991 [Trichonephila clavipes]|nr:hypothetical protein TNCV_4675991 [Trichonephila clavipes]
MLSDDDPPNMENDPPDKSNNYLNNPYPEFDNEIIAQYERLKAMKPGTMIMEETALDHDLEDKNECARTRRMLARYSSPTLKLNNNRTQNDTKKNVTGPRHA